MVNSTQQAIEIAGIKDGILVLKNGSYRMVLQVSATNFALKSEQEQNSLIFQYQGFLNSLHFPIEIVVRSRQLDLSPYIGKIETLLEKQTNELVKMQTTDYIDFLKKLIEMANIMKKTFYVTIPYDPVAVGKGSLLDKFFGKKTTFDHVKISDIDYKAHVNKLKERAGIVASGLGSMGLHCFQLSTQDLIELFYQLYNPDESSKERVKDMTMLASPIILSEEEFGNNSDKNSAQIEEAMIDNANIVEERQKQETQIKKQEELANESKSPEPATSKESPPKAETTETKTVSDAKETAVNQPALANTATNKTNNSDQQAQQGQGTE